MEIIQEFIVMFTLALLFLGWWVHNWTVLSRLTRIKGCKITVAWYVRNRPYKLRISATTSIVSGFIAYIWFHPEGMVLTEQAGRQALAIYMSSIFGIGLGSDFIVDQIGSRAKVIKQQRDCEETENDRN